MIKAVLFDLDGTIILSEPYHHKAFQKVFGKLGLPFEYNYFIENFAGTGSKYIFEKMFEINGIKEDTAPYIAEKKRIYQDLIKKHKLKTVKGFRQFLKELQKRKIKIMIASGTSLDNIEISLKNIGFEKEFPLITSGKEVPSPKPAPDTLLLAAKRLKVKPEECLVLEDAIAGVEAAKAANMFVIAFTTTTKPEKLKKARADLIVKDYTEIDLDKVIKGKL